MTEREAQDILLGLPKRVQIQNYANRMLKLVQEAIADDRMLSIEWDDNSFGLLAITFKFDKKPSWSD